MPIRLTLVQPRRSLHSVARQRQFSDALARYALPKAFTIAATAGPLRTFASTERFLIALVRLLINLIRH